MPFIYKKTPRPDRWLEYCQSVLGVNWSLLKVKLLIVLHMRGEMLAADLAEMFRKPRKHITVYLDRLMAAGKVKARHLPLDTRKLYRINEDNVVLVDMLTTIKKRYGKRLSRKDPFARPAIKMRHPEMRTYTPTKTHRRKKSCQRNTNPE